MNGLDPCHRLSCVVMVIKCANQWLHIVFPAAPMPPDAGVSGELNIARFAHGVAGVPLPTRQILRTVVIRRWHPRPCRGEKETNARTHGPSAWSRWTFFDGKNLDEKAISFM
jgi:hypothetical protein